MAMIGIRSILQQQESSGSTYIIRFTWRISYKHGSQTILFDVKQ